MSDWISVETGLPPDLKQVLVFIEYGEARERGLLKNTWHRGWYSPGYGWYAGDHGVNDYYRAHDDCVVTHWMPTIKGP